MKLVYIVCLLLITGGSALAQTQPKAGDVTESPQRYVLAHSEPGARGIVQFDCSACSSMRDLLFVAAANCGNAGCDFYLFKKLKEKSYRYLTTVFLSAGAFQFLDTEHNGFNDILAYYHMSARDGALAHLQFDGQNYQQVDSDTIDSADFSSRINPEPVSQLFFSLEDIEGKLPAQSTNVRQLTLIGPNNPQFETLLNSAFPGLSLGDYPALRPFTVLLRNDTPFAVNAFTINWQVQGPGGYQTRGLNVFIQKDSGLPSETLPLAPGELRLIILNAVDVAPSEYARTHNVVASILRLLSAHPPPAGKGTTTAMLDAAIYADGAYVGPDHDLLLQKYRAARDAEREEGASVLKLLSSNPSAGEITAALQHDAQVPDLNGSPTHNPDLMYARERALDVVKVAQSLLRIYRQTGTEALSQRAMVMANEPQETISPLAAN